MSFSRLAGRLAVAFLVSVSLPALAHAHEFRVGDLHIDHPWSRSTPPAAKVGAGYLVVTNGGVEADRLVSATSPAAGRVEIHEMRMDGDVMRMRELARGLPLPAGRKVELKPGGYHLMLLELKAPLAVGVDVPVTLVFERAGKVDITLKVEPATTRAPVTGGHRH